MRSTYINRSGKLLAAMAIGIFATVCATLLMALAAEASATAQPSHLDVPKGVRLIDVTLETPGAGSPTTIATLRPHKYVLTSSTTLRNVDQLVNGLGTVPKRAYACPMYVLANQPTLTLAFRGSANGPALAEIQVDVAVGPHHDSGDSPCRPIHYSVRGRTQPALLSATFVASIGHMISANIS